MFWDGHIFEQYISMNLILHVNESWVFWKNYHKLMLQLLNRDERLLMKDIICIVFKEALSFHLFTTFTVRFEQL